MPQLQSTSAISETLAEEGVVMVDGYLSEDETTNIREQIENLLTKDSFKRTSGSMSYSELASADEPIVDERSGENDDGMLDIFNLDVAIPEIESFKHDEYIQRVINDASTQRFSPDNTNAYVNRSVVETRGYHADTYDDKFKSFVYLTDVPDETYGPFSYIKGSHKRSPLKKRIDSVLNRLQGKKPTDARALDAADVKTFTAPAGTLIIANQQGFHRGMPQERGKERMLLTTSYTPTE